MDLNGIVTGRSNYSYSVLRLGHRLRNPAGGITEGLLYNLPRRDEHGGGAGRRIEFRDRQKPG